MPIVVSALISDPEGRIFAQKRSAERKLFPNCWDLVGGHVEDGEEVTVALQREIWEETGWTIRSLGPEISPKKWMVGDVEYLERQFVVTVDGDLNNPHLEVGKATEYRWIEEKDVLILKENRSDDDCIIFDAVVEGLLLTRPAASRFSGKLRHTE